MINLLITYLCNLITELTWKYTVAYSKCHADNKSFSLLAFSLARTSVTSLMLERLSPALLQMNRIIETYLSVHSRRFTGNHREWVWGYNIRWVYIGSPDGFFILFKDADLSVSQWGFHTPSLTQTHVGTIITRIFHWHYQFYSELMTFFNYRFLSLLLNLTSEESCYLTCCMLWNFGDSTDILLM